MLSFWNRTSYRQWHEEIENALSDTRRAYYDRGLRLVVCFHGEKAFRDRDLIRTAGGRVQRNADQVLVAVACHQLLYEYAARLRGNPALDHRDVVIPLWLEKGLGDFMGAVEFDEDAPLDLATGKIFHNRVLLSAVSLAASRRVASLEAWPVEKLFEPRTVDEILIPQDGDDRGLTLGALFYARAGAFVTFAWFYDEGRYRPAFLRYLSQALRGTVGKSDAATVLGVTGPDGSRSVEKEFEWYWRELLRRRGGEVVDTRTGKRTGQSRLSDTSPPTGRAE